MPSGRMTSTSVRDLFDRLTLGMVQTLGERCTMFECGYTVRWEGLDNVQFTT